MSANAKKNSANSSVGKRAEETPFGRRAAAVALSAALAWSLFPAGAVSAQTEGAGEEPVAEQQGEPAATGQDEAEVTAEAPVEEIPAEGAGDVEDEAPAGREQQAAADPEPAAEPEPAGDPVAEPAAQEAAPVSEPVAEGAEQADGQVDVQLELSNAYITYDGQAVAAPATKVTVPSGADFTFSVAANSGYELEGVQVFAGGVQVESGDGAGTYTVAASDVAKSATVKVVAVAQQGEDEAGTEAVALDDSAVVVFASSDKKDGADDDAEASVDGQVSIEVTASGSFAVGSAITYTVSVTNTGKVDLSDVNVVNELSLFDQTVEKLGVGESREFTTSYTVTQFDYDMGSVDNNVFSVSAKDPDGKVVSDSAQVDVCALYAENIADVVYNAADQAVKPVVRDMSDADGAPLAEGEDYELSYSGDVKNVGKVTVTVTGIGKFAGSVQVSYYITPALLKVTTGSASKAYDGTALVADSVEIDGLLGSDSVTARATGSQTEVGSSQNTYDISWTGAEQDNYRVSLLDESLGTLTVTAARSSGEGNNGGGSDGGNGGSGSRVQATGNGGATTSTSARGTGSSSAANGATGSSSSSTGTSGTGAAQTTSSNPVTDALEKGYEAITGDKSDEVTTTERTYDEETPLGMAAPTRTNRWIYFWGIIGLVAAAVLATVVWQLRSRARE